MLTKGPIKTTASYLAQGGVAAAVGPDDDPALHAEDTIAAGRGLSRPSAVSVLTDEAPARVADLADLGVEFDLGLGLEGGHSRARVVHAGGAATGRQIAHTLAERVLDHPRISVRQGEQALEPLVDGLALRRRDDGRRCDLGASDSARDRRRGRALGTDDQSRGRGRRRHRDGLPRGSRGRRSRVHPVPSRLLCAARASSSAKLYAARARSCSTTAAIVSPTSLRRGTSSHVRSERAAQRCSTSARSTGTASRR